MRRRLLSLVVYMSLRTGMPSGRNVRSAELRHDRPSRIPRGDRPATRVFTGVLAAALARASATAGRACLRLPPARHSRD